MPYAVSPLAMTAVLIEAAARDGVGRRSTVVGAYVAVIVLDLVCVLFLDGLSELGVPGLDRH